MLATPHSPATAPPRPTLWPRPPPLVTPRSAPPAAPRDLRSCRHRKRAAPAQTPPPRNRVLQPRARGQREPPRVSLRLPLQGGELGRRVEEGRGAAWECMCVCVRGGQKEQLGLHLSYWVDPALLLPRISSTHHRSRTDFSLFFPSKCNFGDGSPDSAKSLFFSLSQTRSLPSSGKLNAQSLDKRPAHFPVLCFHALLCR